MKICLVRCPAPFLIDDRMFPPLGLMAVGTGLRQAGHDVMIHDGPIADVPLDCDGYGFGPTAPEYPTALKTLSRIRKENRHARMVLGGPHATLNWQTCTSDGWDAVVVGDGENESDQAFRGAYRVTIMAEERPLDEYPITDRSLVDLSTYHYQSAGRPGTTIVTARGCPHRCAFCCKNHTRVRLMSATRAIREIHHLRYDIGFTVLAFPEDNFILDEARTKKLCEVLRAYDVEWRCLVRSDLVVRRGQAFVTMLKDAGCAAVGIGIESGSDKILETINKGETVGTILRSIRMLQAAGIRTRGFFVIGLPGESPETLDATERFLEEAQLDEVDCKIFQPYPGSPIYDNRHQYDISWNGTAMADTFYKGHPGEYHGTISTSALTTEQIVGFWVRMERTYNRRVWSTCSPS